MPRIRSIIVLIAVLSLAVWVYRWHQLSQLEPIHSKQPIQLEEQTSDLPLRTLMFQSDSEQNTERLIACQDRRCQPQPYPHDLPSNAVSNGTFWCYYRNLATSQAKEPPRELICTDSKTNKDQTINAATPLTEPRDHILSPDGRKIAFWLDNIHEPQKKLTELWLYDMDAGNTKIMAEKVHQDDVLTNPRWNLSNSHLWFLADNGSTTKEKKIELVVVGLQPPSVRARFAKIDWAKIQETVAAGPMDISFTGRSVAFAHTEEDQTALTVLHEGLEPYTNSIRGAVPYLQWLEDGSLLYAIQDSRGFGLWKLRGTIHNLIARRSGSLLSARSDVRGEYLIFAAAEEPTHPKLYALHVSSGLVQEQGDIPVFGNLTRIARVEPKTATPTPNVSGTITPLSDAELAAFVDQHFSEIADNATAHPVRLITTDEINTIYVDFRQLPSTEKRLLFTVRDALHPEWSIRARYEAAGGEWRKVQGGGLSDPAPKNIYEWEEGIKKWILKQSATPPSLRVEN